MYLRKNEIILYSEMKCPQSGFYQLLPRDAL